MNSANTFVSRHFINNCFPYKHKCDSTFTVHVGLNQCMQLFDTGYSYCLDQ